MQDTYSLAYAMARDGQAMFGRANSANDAAIVNTGALVPDSSGAQAPITSMSLALANADLQLGGLSLSLVLLRNSVDALQNALSRLMAVDVRSPKTNEPAEQKAATEFQSSKSQDLRLSREAMTLRDGLIPDPIAALRHANANLSFDTTTAAQKSITVLREESTESEKRLSKTLEPTSILGEETWLKNKTSVIDSANDLASGSPVVASAIKTADAVISPIVSGFVSGLGEKIKDRVTGNVVDLTLGKLPGIGKLFKDGGYDKDKEKGKDPDKQCCCPGTASLGSLGRLDSATAGLPESVGETARKKDTARPGGNPKRPSGKRYKTRQSRSRAVKTSVVRTSAALNPQRAAPAVSVAPALSAMEQPRVAPNSKLTSPASTRLPGNSVASFSASSIVRPVAGGATKGLTTGLSGVLAKLESAGARRLGPMKYADTAFDVIQGVRNGDANAIGAGLSTAGGAWAGASAGAAIGTLVFPGVGTAVGGAIGGLLGSEAGSWLGDKLFGAGDRLPASNAVSKELNSARTDSVQVTIAPSIQITGVNPADAQQVVNQVIQALQFQCMPMVTDSLGIRRNAALADPGGD